MEKTKNLMKKASVLLGGFLIACGLVFAAAPAKAVNVKQVKDKVVMTTSIRKVTLDRVAKSRDIVKKFRNDDFLDTTLAYYLYEKFKWGKVESYNLKGYDATKITATYKGGYWKYKDDVVVVAAPQSKTIYILNCSFDEEYYKRYHPDCEAFIQSFDKKDFPFKKAGNHAKVTKTPDVASFDADLDWISNITRRIWTIDYSTNPSKTSAINIANDVKNNTAMRELVVRRLLTLTNQQNPHKIKLDLRGKAKKYVFEDPAKSKYDASYLTMKYSDGFDKNVAKVVFVNFKEKKQAVAMSAVVAEVLYSAYTPLVEGFFQGYEADHFSVSPLKINKDLVETAAK